MKGFIYLITNEVNRKGYVGKTSFSIERRWAEHLKAAKNPKNVFALYVAIRKYGAEKFSIREVASCDEADLNDLEKHYIQYLGTFANSGHGYNMTEGGDGGSGYIFTQEVRDKISRALKGKPKTEEARRNSGLARRGHKMSAKTRQGIMNANLGRQKSDEERKRLSASLKGHAPTNRFEHLKGKSAWNKGRKLPSPSPETLAKMSKAQTARWLQ